MGDSGDCLTALPTCCAALKIVTATLSEGTKGVSWRWKRMREKSGLELNKELRQTTLLATGRKAPESTDFSIIYAAEDPVATRT